MPGLTAGQGDGDSSESCEDHCNTGKSNILESLALISFAHYGKNSESRKFLRYDETRNLFHDGDVQE